MTFWTIARNDLKIDAKDRMFFFWLLFFPLLFAFIFGMAFPGEREKLRQVSLSVIDKDQSFLSRALTEELKGERYDVRLITDEEDKAARTLVIPEGFARSILSGQKVELVLEQKEESNQEASQAAYSNILKAIIKILTKIISLPAAEGKELEQKFNELRLERLITLKSELAGKLVRIPGGFNRMIPASAVMFILFMVFMYGGISLLVERREGLLERVYLSPASYASIIGGKWLSRLLLGMLQMTLLFLAGKVLFKTYLGSSIPALFLVSLFFCGAVAGMSILMGSLIRKEEVMIVFNILLANLMAALGGCWMPLELFPPGLKTVSYAFPTGWAMDAFNKLIFFGYNLESVLPNIAVLFVFSLVFFALASKFFKLRKI
ncbi:MAG: ABC transporter permease [Clostridiales bacterium]|nr:ABC transporter permease [Clostridiales bacterium]